MFGLPLAPLTPATIPFTSTPTQRQTRGTRSPLARAAHKLKKVFIRPRLANTVSVGKADEANCIQSSLSPPHTNSTAIASSTTKRASQLSPNNAHPATDPVARFPSKIAGVSPSTTGPLSSPPMSRSSTPNPASSNRNERFPTTRTSPTQEIIEREKARVEAYLKLTGYFRPSVLAAPLTKQELMARDRHRGEAYLKLIGAFRPPFDAEKMTEQEIEEEERLGNKASMKGEAEFRRWGAAEQAVELEIERELAHRQAHLKLTESCSEYDVKPKP